MSKNKKDELIFLEILNFLLDEFDKLFKFIFNSED